MLSQFEILDQVDRVSQLSDDSTVSPAFAAVYLGMSEKSLGRTRQRGDGPAYIQYPAAGSKARNQLVTYKMFDLRSYQRKHKVTSSMEAAVIRGMALTSSSALKTEQPFFVRVNENGTLTIISHILSLIPPDFSDYIETASVDNDVHTMWLSWQEALNGCNWDESDIEVESMFRKKYCQLLEKISLSKISKHIKTFATNN